MKLIKLHEILSLIVEFASSKNDVLAIGLCGSWARGTAGPYSDIDLSIIVCDKLRFKSTDWLAELDFKEINDGIDTYKDVVYGQVWSRHVFLNSKIEIEFSFADRSWADTENMDEGTRKVVSDGFRIIYDPYLILNDLTGKIFIE